MSKFSGIFVACLFSFTSQAQVKSLVNTSASPHAKLRSVDMGSVTWNGGFWGERMKVCAESMVPGIWHTYHAADISHAYKNFEIAAGLDTGSHSGPSFHDGDFYKMLEAATVLYSQTKDEKLNKLLDASIATVALSQRADGYIYTASMIEQRKTGKQEQFQDRLSFESYNIGHLMTAGCIHYRATGKTNLLEVAKKATEYLYDFYKRSSPTLSRNAICPSHYMGVVEMYRTLGEPRYLELAKHLIDIKGKIEDGTDDNQDRIPFREQTKAMGHAVRANYLYAGVTDVFAETGDTSLWNKLELIWDNMVNTKMYITGACGALYDGVSPYGTSYKPPVVQKTHQAFGRDFQLPNMTAHNETCANIGNLLWNWRMLQVSADAKYMDVLEKALYNSILSGISLDGKDFFYTNPLSQKDDFPYELRWSGGRIPYIRLSNCCPPNVVRTIAEVANYAYNISDKGVYCNLYGSNQLKTSFGSGAIEWQQISEYPWKDKITIQVKKAPAEKFSVFMRIPGWCNNARLTINGKPLTATLKPGTYAEINRKWLPNDVIVLQLPMPVRLMESNPLVEETRNQVAVTRGPLVYCLESADFKPGTRIFDIVLPANANLTPVSGKMDDAQIVRLNGRALIKESTDWQHNLYKEKSKASSLKPINISLIPYYAWANRGKTEMSVWIPVQ